MTDSNGSIKILVGAAADRSVEKVFGDVEKRALRASATIARAFTGGGGFKQIGDGANAAFGQVEKGAKRAGDSASREAQRVYSQQRKALDRYAKDQDRAYERQQRQAARSAEAEVRQADMAARRKIAIQNRSFADEQRARARSDQLAESYARREERQRRKEAYQTAYHGVIRYFPAAISHAARFASGILHGAGVDWDAGESVRRNVELGEKVRHIRNQATLVGQDLSTPEIQKSIRSIAQETGYSNLQVAEGVTDFGKTTGDPKQAMALARGALQRAAAASAGPEEMMALAGDIASHLGDSVKDKVGATLAVIDAAILQGAKGAIEIGQQAKLFPTIGAAAGQFEGSEQQNMIKLGALAQLVRRTGGARNPAQAFTAIERFTTQLTTPARYKQFQALGFDRAGTDRAIMSKTERGKLADPIEILKNLVVATGGDPMRMQRALQSSIGVKPAKALARSFIETRNEAMAHGVSAKEAERLGVGAVNRKIDEFTNVSGIDDKIKKANAERDNDIDVRATRFRNSLDAITNESMSKLLPALEKLEPTILRMAQAFADFVGWAASNPWSAVSAAFAASIARAGIESVIRTALEKAMLGGKGVPPPGGGTGGTGGPGGGAGTAGKLGAGLAVLGGAAGGFAASGAAMTLGAHPATIKGLGLTIAAGALGGASFGPVGMLAGATIGALQAGNHIIDNSLGGGGGLGAGINTLLAGEGFFKGFDAYMNRKAVAEAKKREAAGGAEAPPAQTIDQAGIAKAVVDAQRGTVQQVRIVNLPAIVVHGGPTADPGGRTAPPPAGHR